MTLNFESVASDKLFWVFVVADNVQKWERLIDRCVLEIFQSLVEWKDVSEVGSYLGTTLLKIKDIVHFFSSKKLIHVHTN